MHSETEEYTEEFVYSTYKQRSSNFELYEEYSQVDINETVRKRRDNYDRAPSEVRKKLERHVQDQVEGFRTWLIETKSFQPLNAHYYSVSLKSLLLGLPIGVQIAKLFDIALNTVTNNKP